MRPTGKLKIEVVFETELTTNKEILEEAFESASLKLGVKTSYVIEPKRVLVVIEYKINTNLTGVINSLKATSSRAMSDKKKDETFWKAGYSYQSLGI